MCFVYNIYSLFLTVPAYLQCQGENIQQMPLQLLELLAISHLSSRICLSHPQAALAVLVIWIAAHNIFSGFSVGFP